jgi:hypothetical protein
MGPGADPATLTSRPLGCEPCGLAMRRVREPGQKFGPPSPARGGARV